MPEGRTRCVVAVFEFDTPVAVNEFDVYQTGDAIRTAVDFGGHPFDADDRVNEAQGALLAQPQATVSDRGSTCCAPSTTSAGVPP